ncbi:MAG: hypothetical protein HYR96_15735 [Deltaproteobacteria bacterium]|nr:hypothetical protein [Deltaproteobacteria bacterium]
MIHESGDSVKVSRGLIVPGGIIRKHIHFYKKILGLEFTPKTQVAKTA